MIEAIFEELEAKKKVFADLDRIMAKGAIMASNTSNLDIDQIAAATARPQDVIGLHFFSPANIMKLLEIVRGGKTSPEVVATALALAKRLDKQPVVAPGLRRLHRQPRLRFLLAPDALPGGGRCLAL